MRFFLLFFLIINISLADESEKNAIDLKQIESQIQTAVKKLHPANVVLRGKTGKRSGSGSGVIVSKEGIILSAAHVTAGHKTMDVVFNDGTRAKAKVLGSHAKRDISMLEITTEGEGDWPFSEIGKSASLQPTDLVISLGHAGGFDSKRSAPVRFGRIVYNNVDQFVTSDCQMIGGDSGGGLFTLDGKLVAIHSNIGTSLSANNHAPVDVAVDNWDRMYAGEDVSGAWKERSQRGRRSEPKKEQGDSDKAESNSSQSEDNDNQETAKPKPKPKKIILEGLDKKLLNKNALSDFLKTGKSGNTYLRLEPDSEQLRNLLVGAGAKQEQVDKLNETQLNMLFTPAYFAYRIQRNRQYRKVKQESYVQLNKQYKQFMIGFEPAVKQADQTIVAFYNDFESEKVLALGTIVDPRGFILTKHSEVKKKDLLNCSINGQRMKTEFVKVWDDHDLVLIQVMNDELTAVQWSNTEDLKLGTLLVAPNINDKDPVGIGVVSVAARSLSSENKGWLGIHLEDHNKGILILSVGDKSPAKLAGLKKNDIITHLNGAKTGELAKFIESIGSKNPGDRVKTKILRGEEEINIRVKLGERPKTTFENSRIRRMNEMSGERSDFRDGFPNIIQTDIALEPEEQGGPVITLDGKVIGINIARAGRIKTYTLPSETILELLAEVDFHRYINPDTDQIKAYELLE